MMRFASPSLERLRYHERAIDAYDCYALASQHLGTIRSADLKSLSIEVEIPSFFQGSGGHALLHVKVIGLKTRRSRVLITGEGVGAERSAMRLRLAAEELMVGGAGLRGGVMSAVVVLTMLLVLTVFGWLILR